MQNSTFVYLEISFLAILISYISLIYLTILIFFRKKFLETIFFLNLNYIGEDSWESLGLQGDPTSLS